MAPEPLKRWASTQFVGSTVANFLGTGLKTSRFLFKVSVEGGNCDIIFQTPNTRKTPTTYTVDWTPQD